MANFWDNDEVVGTVAEAVQNVGQKIVDNNQTIKAVSSVASAASSAASAVSSSLPTWQSVVDTAAEAMEGVSSRWTDVAGKAYELLPEAEDVAEVLGGIPSPVDTLTGGVSKAATIVKAVNSPVGRNFLNDVLFGGNTSQRIAGAEIFSSGGIELIRKLVIDAGILESKSVEIGKEIYNKLDGGISLNQSEGSSASTIIKKLADGDPANEIKLMLGQFSARIDENNDIIVSDRFNYNDFKNPLDGKTYNAEEYDAAIKEGKFTQVEVLQSIFSGELNYAMVRAAGFVIGSKERKDPSQTEGRVMEINLGPAN